MAYPIVVVVVPRRAGKTIAVLARNVAKCLHIPRARCWYTAHRREVGSALWRSDWYPLLRAGLGDRVALRFANGSETIEVLPGPRASTVRLFAPSGEALRSQDADLVTVDEAREFSLEDGTALEGAVRPAQLARAGRQLYLVSSAGDALSTWLLRYRDLGRAAADAGDTRGGVAYFEWSTPTSSGDPMDRRLWWAAHPALGYHVAEEALAADAATMHPDTFATEYLGWWLEPRRAAAGLDLAEWSACAADLEPSGRPSFAFDVAQDRRSAALAMAAPVGDRLVVEVLEHRAGVDWLVPIVADLRRRSPGATIAADALHCAGVLADLERAHVTATPVNAADYTRACSTFATDVTNDHRIAHRSQEALDAAVAGAARRPVGDSWAWSRARAGVDLSPLVAVTLASWAARTAPPPRRPAIGGSGPR